MAAASSCGGQHDYRVRIPINSHGGRVLRTLMIIDDFTQKCLAIEVDRRFSSRRVIRALEAIAL